MLTPYSHFFSITILYVDILIISIIIIKNNSNIKIWVKA